MRMTEKITICLLGLAIAGFAYGDRIVTLQGSAANVQDAYLRAYKPTINYGDSTTLRLDGRYGTSTYWSCIKFEMPTISAHEYVSNAVMQVYYNSYSGTGTDTTTWNMNQLLTPWVESEVTWNSANNSTVWTGGTIDAKTVDTPNNYATALLGSISMNITDAYGWKSFGSTVALTTLVDEMCKNTADNNGFIINRARDYTDNNYYNFYSSDYTDDTTLQPKLILTIVPEPTTITVVIQGSVDTQDSYLRNYHVDSNYGTSETITLNDRMTSNVQWGVIKFDLPTLAPGRYVSDAVLELNQTSGGAVAETLTVDLNQLLTPWVENEVTWNSADSANAWNGGSIDDSSNYGDSLVAVTMDDTTGWKIFSSTELTMLIDKMYQGTTNNYGFLINAGKSYEDDTYYYFASSDNTTTTIQPKLTLTLAYPPPTGTLLIIQ